ncbi:gephyrin [Kalaharituber pfeilii]|nr:gephyrin [Kalaharituber pfeilii]
MSRPVAGSRHGTVVVTLPGSPKGAKENLEAIIKLLPHACIQTAGLQSSRKLHSGGVKALESASGLSSTPSTTLPVKEPGHHSSLITAPGTSATRRLRASPYPMISMLDAHALISKHTPAGAEIITRPVDSSLIGYVLAYDIRAPVPVPAFRASIVDGYAVVGTDGPGIYPVVAVSHAAPSDPNAPPPSLQPGQIARITTGAPVPAGATAVVMVEDTRLIESTPDGKEELKVEILASNMGPDENVRQIGSDVAMGSKVLSKDTEVAAAGGEIGVLASLGISEVKVYRKPIVGIMSTGDEVVEHNRPGDLRTGEIRDSNRPTLIAAVKSWGYEVVDLGIIKDQANTLESTLRDALSNLDVLISTGGVSMGELDLLKPTIQHSLNGTIHFGRVAMKPGKPTTFATVPSPSSASEIHKLLFALPGNPASALVTFHLFVLPALRQFSGVPVQTRHLPRVKVTLENDVPLDPRPEFVRAVVTWDAERAGGQLAARTTGGQRSSRVGSLVGANALLCMPAKGEAEAEVSDKRRERGAVPAGERVEAILIGRVV